MTNSGGKKIALIHDALCVTGGAERLFYWVCKAFPQADIFTSVYLPEKTFPEFKSFQIKTLPGSGLIHSERQFKLLFPWWLAMLKRWRFSEYDVVFSSSTYLAKYIHPATQVIHRSYLHAPFRFLWKPESYSDDSLPTPPLVTSGLKLGLPALRQWDIRETNRINQLATNCQNVAAEIQRIYQKDAVVIHPPVPVDEFSLGEGTGDYFLSVSRLISHKRVDLAVKACSQLKKRLIVVGDGPERSNLEKIAGDTVTFAGKVGEDKLHRLFAGSRALIFPSREDYGIAPLEAQACGRPVIAFGQGGVLETVVPGKTGLLFADQTVDSLTGTLQEFEQQSFDAVEIRGWARQFDMPTFNDQIQQFVTGN
mgnify:CR=1 FL=1